MNKNEPEKKPPVTGSEKTISRRELLKTTALTLGSAALPALACGGPGTAARKIDKRVIILGFDAVSPWLLRRYISGGHLPNFEALSRDGGFTELQSSIPPESPVAWSTFSVSAQAGVHGIYDFLNRDLETYTPRITSVKPVYPRFLWDYIPLGRPEAISLQSGKPFWVHAAEQGVKCAVLEAPVAFPAYEMQADSMLLSGLTTPDIRGTQATYHFFTTDIFSEDVQDTEFGGKVSRIEFGPDRRAEAMILGPWSPITRQKRKRLLDKRKKMVSSHATGAELAELDRAFADLEQENYITVPLAFELSSDRSRVTIELQGQKFSLAQGEWSRPVEIEFSLNLLVQFKGFTRFIPTELGDEVKIFMSPIEIHPEEPVMPISWPDDFSAGLSHKIGLYKTRGWAAETSALKELKLDEKAFMEDLDMIIDKREAMALEVLETEKPNLFFEVFSAPDRVQHMFWRIIDKEHPLYDPGLDERFGDAILHVYKRMDSILGRIRKRFEDENTLLVVLSDHGFASFRKGVNLNTWLVNNGFMKLKGQDDPRYNLRDLFGGGDFFTNVDWSGTRAYSLGLGLIYINLKGREAMGIVEQGEEYDSIVKEISEGLLAFRDPEDNARVVYNIYPGREVYSGSRLDEAPDLVVGLNHNYRVSWQTALGGVPPDELETNMEKWCGDHCSVDRDLVPGVLLVNRAIERRNPDLRDIAPTVLKFLGCSVPEEYEGCDLFEA